MNTIQRGAIAELVVAAELTKKGCVVSLPLSHGSSYDLIVDINNNLLRIQVKRAYSTNNHGSKALCVETRRILVKHSSKKGSVARQYANDSFDFLIACDVDDNNFWIIPLNIVKSYKAQIYLNAARSKEFKNNWTFLEN